MLRIGTLITMLFLGKCIFQTAAHHIEVNLWKNIFIVAFVAFNAEFLV